VVCKQKQAATAAAAAATQAGPSQALPAAAGLHTAESAGSPDAAEGVGRSLQQQQQQRQQQRACSSASSSPTPSTEALMASIATASPGQKQQQQLMQDQASVVHQLQAELGSLARELAQLKRSQQQQRSDSTSRQSCSPGNKQVRALEPFAAAGPLAHELQVMRAGGWCGACSCRLRAVGAAGGVASML
jgi:hypothetical protein